MIYHIYAMKNVAISAYQGLHVQNCTKEDIVASLKRSLVLKPQLVEEYKYSQLVCFGTFDDETGEFKVTEPELLFDCTSVKKEEEK